MKQREDFIIAVVEECDTGFKQKFESKKEN